MAHRRSCPRCDLDGYDMRFTRVMRVKYQGYKVGLGAGRGEVGLLCPGCVVM